MPNVSSFGAQTDNSVVQGTVTDRAMVTPDIPPQGLMSVGPRVTPHFVKPSLWSALTTYHFFDAVHDAAGASYVAIKPEVPAGTELTDEDYWFLWADPNSQFADLSELVKTYNGRITQNAEDIDGLKTEVATKATFFDTLEELKQSGLPVGRYAHIERVHTGNDKGFGFYKIVSENTPFSYRMSNGLFAKLLYDDSTTVDSFGAYGDGVTDDSHLFEEIINARIPLNLNSRTYLVANSINCTNDLTIKGVSRLNDSSKIKLSKTGFIDVNQHIVNITDVAFEGYSETDKTENGIINLHTEINLTNVQARYFKTFLKYASNVWGGFGTFNNCKIVYCDTFINAPDSIRFNQNVFTACIFQHYQNLFDSQRCESLYFNGCDFENGLDNAIILGAGKAPAEFYGVKFNCCYLEGQKHLLESSYGCNIVFDGCWYYNSDTFLLENVSGHKARTLITFKNNVLNTKDIIKDSTINVFFENNTVQDQTLNTGFTGGTIAPAGFEKLVNIRNEGEALSVSGTNQQNSSIVSILRLGTSAELPSANSFRTTKHTLFAFVQDTKKLMYFNTDTWVEVVTS